MPSPVCPLGSLRCPSWGDFGGHGVYTSLYQTEGESKAWKGSETGEELALAS